jgi:uncharacterized membrane protein
MSGKGKNRDDRKLPANDLDHRPGERVNDSTFRPREGMVLARSSFVGPMPPPELVAEYEEILPGAANFFFSALDAQTTHRHMLEAKVVEANISNEKVGMWLAFTLAFTMIVCGTFLI